MPWWGKSQEPKQEQQKEVETKKLPQTPQKGAQNGDSLDGMNESHGTSTTDTNLRYAAYGSRIRTLLISSHRYIAYSSEVGESFRPVAHPTLVRAAYGVSWIYLFGDVGYEGYKSYWRNQRVVNPQLQLTEQQEKMTGMPAAPVPGAKPGVVSPLEDYRTVMVQRAIFQSLASMGLPAFTIHSVVKYSGKAMKNMKNQFIRTWAPVGLGLSVVPFLPVMFDEPVEHAVEWAFHKGFEAYGGKEYVAHVQVGKKEKEL